MSKQINVIEAYKAYLKSIPVTTYIRLNRVQDFIEILNSKSAKGRYTLHLRCDCENWKKTDYTLKFGGIEVSKATAPTKVIENLGNRHFLIVKD